MCEFLTYFKNISSIFQPMEGRFNDILDYYLIFYVPFMNTTNIVFKGNNTLLRNCYVFLK